MINRSYIVKNKKQILKGIVTSLVSTLILLLILSNNNDIYDFSVIGIVILYLIIMSVAFSAVSIRNNW